MNQFLVREDKSALAWIVSQYKEKKLHKNTVFATTEHPQDYCREQQSPTYLFDLILKIITVSLKTINIKNSYRLEYQTNQTFILKTSR